MIAALQSFSRRHTAKCLLMRARTISSLSQVDVQLSGYEVASTTFQRIMQEDNEARDVMVYCLSFSEDKSAYVRSLAQQDAVMNRQLEFSEITNMLSKSRHDQSFRPISQSEKPKIDMSPLPTTLKDALRPSKSRAIVVTEAVKPFRIVDVNRCWENLCGYTYSESRGKTLGALLKGPETDEVAATGLISKLLQGEHEASTVLVNYTKVGRRFRNRVRVGPLYDEHGNVSHFVGMLREMSSA